MIRFEYMHFQMQGLEVKDKTIWFRSRFFWRNNYGFRVLTWRVILCNHNHLLSIIIPQ